MKKKKQVRFEVTEDELRISAGEIEVVELARLIRSGELFGGLLDEAQCHAIKEAAKGWSDTRLVETVLRAS